MLSSLFISSAFKAIILLQLLGWVFLPVYIAGGVSRRSFSPTYYGIELVPAVSHLCCDWLIGRARFSCKAHKSIILLVLLNSLTSGCNHI